MRITGLMSFPNPDTPEHELRQWDADSFDERLARLICIRKLENLPETGRVLPASAIAGSLWWEATRSFIGGNFIAAIMLAQSFIEHSLAEVLRRRGRAASRTRSFKALIDDAEQLKEIPPSLATGLHNLRMLRNPYVHPEVESWPPAFVERTWEQTNGDPYHLNFDDACLALETAGEYIKHIAERWDRPFSPGGQPDA